ncbi:alfa-L-rhamnosidase [Microdochium bolleyi]|uniref:alpha-L-rhamnosidase n=1 Tax=Microdochium bolleyi TaxID=196109 RepID=A0A136ILX7_9PEZI|nr:alfa-L-rhamnosidase [Microdochium bolleyi]
MASPTVTQPVFEHHHSGLSVNTSRPRISWAFQADENTTPDWRQTAYEVEITFHPTSHDPLVFNVTSDRSVLVPWPARPLQPREAANVRVRVAGGPSRTPSSDDAQYSGWSSPATVEAALLDPSEFQAQFITAAQQPTPQGPLRPLRFRKEFNLPVGYTGETCRSRLYITALGLYEVYINGQRVGDEYMAPGWTSYKHRLPYQVHDVAVLLNKTGPNMLAIEAAEGWYAGRLGFNGGKRFRWGDKIGVAAQLEVTHPTSSQRWTLSTDETWRCGLSPVQTSEIYDGEVYDAREEDESWNKVTEQDSAQVPLDGPVVALPRPKATLFSPDMAPVRATEVKPCVSVFQSKSGKTILDFGQNLVGVVRIKSFTPADGAQVELRHAEVMEHGELGTRPLKLAKARCLVTGSGKTIDSWRARFTFFGFRYVQVEGWPSGTPSADDFEALVLHTDMKRRGFFECSNQSVNQLHQNVVWSMRGNFLSIPTDCPQRDERLGWTGDAQVFAPTSAFLYDTMGILGSWLEDLAAEQLADGQKGIPPITVPFALGDNFPNMPQAIWADVAVLMPDDLHRASGDEAILERQFRSMQTWIEQGVDRGANGLWNPDSWQFADWLDPNAPPEDPANGRTDPLLVCNAYLVHTTRVFSQICRRLGKMELADKHKDGADRLLGHFQRHYMTADGHLMSSTQTAIALCITFDLYPPAKSNRTTASSALERLVRTANYHISTGFAGTPVITKALTAAGKPQLAYRMLLKKDCPSWLYPVTMGATTIWERWNSMMPDGTINPGHMTSFNHYALGAVADWLHATVGGISPAAPGWRTIRVRPVPGGNITSTNVRFNGPYGLVACEWQLKNETDFSMKLTVPPNCTAEVTLPCDFRASFLNGVEDGDGEAEKTTIVGSGFHTFKCEFVAGEWPPKRFGPPFLPHPPIDVAE